MKSVNSKMQFGFSVVNAGQRNTVQEPQFIAVSTPGSFRVTAPVTKFLELQHGDYLMFVNNYIELEKAVREKNEAIVEFCQANGLDIEDPSTLDMIYREFGMWGIAKGIKEYDSKGNVRTTTERLTKKDKQKYVTANLDVMLSGCLESEEVNAEIKEALTREGVTPEEQIDILIDFVTHRDLPKFKGSKLANASGITGIGISLNCTDSNVWNQLKSDLEEPEKVNRVFDIDFDNCQEITMSNGYEDITVKALILGNYVDKEPSRIGEGGTKE